MDIDPFEQKKPVMRDDYGKQIVDISTRIRLLEERYSNFRREEQLTEQNIIHMEKKISQEFKELDQQLLELKRKMNDLKDDLTMMSGEMGRSVKTHEFKALEKYVHMWMPVDFVTRNEAENLLRKVYK